MIHTNADRFGDIFYLYDYRRGWWETSTEPEVSRRVFTILESQLHGLAGSTNPQLPSHTAAVPNSIYPVKHLRHDAIADIGFSLSYPPWESHGQPISH